MTHTGRAVLIVLLLAGGLFAPAAAALQQMTPEELYAEMNENHKALIKALQVEGQKIGGVIKDHAKALRENTSAVGSIAQLVHNTNATLFEVNKILVKVDSNQTVLQGKLSNTQEAVTGLKIFAYVFLSGAFTLASVITGAFLNKNFEFLGRKK